MRVYVGLVVSYCVSVCGYGFLCGVYAVVASGKFEGAFASLVLILGRCLVICRLKFGCGVIIFTKGKIFLALFHEVVCTARCCNKHRGTDYYECVEFSFHHKTLVIIYKTVFLVYKIFVVYIITQKGLIYCLKGSLNVHPSFQRLHPYAVLPFIMCPCPHIGHAEPTIESSAAS